MLQSLSGSAVVFTTSCNTFNPFCENKLKRVHSSTAGFRRPTNKSHRTCPALLTHLCYQTMKLHITAIMNPTKKTWALPYDTWHDRLPVGMENNWFSVWLIYAYTSAMESEREAEGNIIYDSNRIQISGANYSFFNSFKLSLFIN